MTDECYPYRKVRPPMIRQLCYPYREVFPPTIRQMWYPYRVNRPLLTGQKKA